MDHVLVILLHVVGESSGKLPRESREQRRAAAAAAARVLPGLGQGCQRAQHIQHDVMHVNLAKTRGEQSASDGELPAQATADGRHVDRG